MSSKTNSKGVRTMSLGGHGYFKGVSKMCYAICNGVSRITEGIEKNVSKEFQACFKVILE